MSLPRVFSILLVKNEADILEHTVRQAKAWSERIFIYDNMSTDGSWELARSLEDRTVVAWKRTSEPFRRGMRAEVFAEFRHLAREGDWWCRLDADEIYVEDPRLLLRAVPARHHTVWGIALEYYLTSGDVETLDFTLPIAELLPSLRHYRAENSELRFIRHRSRLRWEKEWSWPRHAGVAHPRRVLYRHYKYRSPEQIVRRLATRQEARARGGEGWWDDAVMLDWRTKLVDAGSCEVDHGTGSFVIAADRLPDHRGPRLQRMVKHLLHQVGFFP